VNLNRIHVETAFNDLVRSSGGTLISEKLPYSPDFQNADYVFHSEKIVAELKCITDDNIHSHANRLKADKLIDDWYRTGKIPSKETGPAEWAQMPNELQNRIYRIFTNNIKRRISKANRQIRETKRELRLEHYTGLLIIANDGILSLPPAAFIHAVQLALQKDFREIRHFIFFTANIFTQTREAPAPSLFWISFDMQDGPWIDPVFLERLGHSWQKHCTDLFDAASFGQEIQDIKGFWHSQNFGKL
jgi:hypothetical protein